MQTSSLFAAAIIVFGLLACTANGNGTPATGKGAPGTDAQTGNASSVSGLSAVPGSGGSATCDDACAHYLQCKESDSTENRSQCNQQCAELGASADQLANFVAADCASAVAAIEGSAPTASANSGGTGADCNGCVWDGGSCIYLTGSSGSYFACDASCCPGH